MALGAEVHDPRSGYARLQASLGDGRTVHGFGTVGWGLSSGQRASVGYVDRTAVAADILNCN